MNTPFQLAPWRTAHTAPHVRLRPPVRAGPFKDVGAANFHGKIKDKRCRKPLYTPTNWDPSVRGRGALVRGGGVGIGQPGMYQM